MVAMLICCCNVGDVDEEFTVELHHGGFFLGQDSNKSYVGGKVSYFDHCEVDTWLIVWIDDFLCQLHYPMDPDRQVYWLLPGKALSNGLRIVSSNTKIIAMQSLVHEVKNFVLYIDHGNSISGFNWDDIVANPVATLPKEFSPQKVINAGERIKMPKRGVNWAFIKINCKN
jgi:hypothetical protein